MTNLTQSKTETNKKREQLDYVQFDVDFFSKPKISAIKYKYGSDGLLGYMQVLFALGQATNAEIHADCYYGVMLSAGFSPEKSAEMLDYFLAFGVLEKTSQGFITNSRIAEDQESISAKREVWREGKRKQRESSGTSIGQPQDISRTTGGMSDRTLNTEDLNTEDLNLEVRKGSGETLKPFRPHWLDKIPIPIAFDEQKTRKALARWVEYCSKKGREFDEIQAETLLYNSINFGANLEKAIFQAVQNGWRSVRFDALGALEPQENPDASLDAVQLVRKKLAGGSNGKS